MIYDVGIDMNSLVDEYGAVVGTCIIYGENSITERIFFYDSNFDSVRGVTIPRKIVDEPFSEEEFFEAEIILFENIKSNIDNIYANLKLL